MSQGWRAVGGRLAVAGDHIQFTPHGLDRATGGKSIDYPLARLTSIDVAPATLNPLDGGLRRRLRLRFDDERAVLFVVWGPEELGDRIRSAAEAAGGSPHTEA